MAAAIRRDEHGSLLDLYMRAIAEPALVAEAAFFTSFVMRNHAVGDLIG